MSRIPRKNQLAAVSEENVSFEVTSEYSRSLPLASLLRGVMIALFTAVWAVLAEPGLRWRGYCQMFDRDHHLITVEDQKDEGVISRFLHRKNNRFSKLQIAHNGKLRRGGLVIDRPATRPRERGLPTLMTLFFLHLKPVREGMVEKPEDWPYSSYLFYAEGRLRFWWERFITPPEEYLALGGTPEERQRAFRLLSKVFAELLQKAEGSAAMEPDHGIVGDAAFVRRYFERLYEILDRNDADGQMPEAAVQALDGMKRDAEAASPEADGASDEGAAGAGAQETETVAGDASPATESAAETGSPADAPAHRWFEMENSARRELAELINGEWHQYRRAYLPQHPGRYFLPSEQLEEQLGKPAEGFETGYLEAEPESARPQWRRMSEGGKAPANELAEAVAAEVCTGAPDCKCHVCSSDLAVESGPDADREPANADPGAPAEDGAGRKTSRSSRKEAEAAALKAGAAWRVEVDAWAEKNREVLEKCGIDPAEAVRVFIGGEKPRRRRRTAPQI